MRSCEDNFKILIAFTSKKKRIGRFEGLPQFKWTDLGGQDVIGQGSFGAVFVTEYTRGKDGEIAAVHVNHQSSALATLNQGHTPPGFDSSFAQSSAPHNQIGLNNMLHSAVGRSNGGFLASHGQYHSSFINQNIPLSSHLGDQNPSVPSQQHQSYAGQVVGMPGPNNSSFQLKWVAGTKVWRQRGRMVRAPDLKSVGRGFKCRSDR